MFERLMEILFPPPKTELELAVDKILAQTHVSNHSLTPTNPYTGTYFAVGKIKMTYSSMGIDHMDIWFSKNDNEVVIKYKKEIIYMFNTPDDVQEIRKAVIKCFETAKAKKRKEKLKEFNEL
jgi:hypothetical protein